MRSRRWIYSPPLRSGFQPQTMIDTAANTPSCPLATMAGVQMQVSSHSTMVTRHHQQATGTPVALHRSYIGPPFQREPLELYDLSGHLQLSLPWYEALRSLQWPALSTFEKFTPFYLSPKHLPVPESSAPAVCPLGFNIVLPKFLF